jgi:nucleoside-diphosphate-sugar epimerase
MKVLVIGGTGYIGSHTVEELARRGHEVSVFARGLLRPSLPQIATFIKGDRHNPEDLSRLRSRKFEAVIDINAYTREESQAVINLFGNDLHRFVHLSTVSVYPLTSVMPLAEDNPLVTDPTLHYGYNKAECERALRWAFTRNGFPYVAIRPPAVFGPRDDKSRENYYLKRIVAGDPVIIPDSGVMPIFAVYVKDLALAMVNAITAEGITGKAFNLAQAEMISINDHISNIAQLAQSEAQTLCIPSRLLERLGFNLHYLPYYSGGRLIMINTASASEALGFRPTPYRKALGETIEYFLERIPETQKSVEDRMHPVMPRTRERALFDRYRGETRLLEDRLTDEWLNEAMPSLNDE